MILWFFLEYAVYYLYHDLFIDKINSIIVLVNDKNKIQMENILLNFEIKIDNFYYDLFIEKIKLYIDYKKNNKDYAIFIDTGYLFISIFSKCFL